MNMKIRRPRSCLGWFLWVFGVLVIFVLLYNGYAQARIALARMQAEGSHCVYNRLRQKSSGE